MISHNFAERALDSLADIMLECVGTGVPLSVDLETE